MRKPKKTKLQLWMDKLLDDLQCSHPKAPIKVTTEPGDGRLMILTGDNASGKSLLTRQLYLRCKSKSIECIRTGMDSRTASGLHRVFMYGDESYDSTGNISAKSVQGAFSTCRNREHEHLLVLDEPDLGLSEGYQSALGKFIAEFVADMPDHTIGLLLVTHSRYLLKELLPLQPHHVRCGDNRTLESIVNDPAPEVSVEDLLKLKEVSVQRMRAINKWCKS